MKEKRGIGVKNGGVRLPMVSIVLMVIFTVGGSLMILADWPAGPANLDWGVLIRLRYNTIPQKRQEVSTHIIERV